MRLTEILFRYKRVPTFSEFVYYLLSTEVETYNEHWLPYYLLCTPCHLNYTVIARTEEIEDDSRSIMKESSNDILCFTRILLTFHNYLTILPLILCPCPLSPLYAMLTNKPHNIGVNRS